MTLRDEIRVILIGRVHELDADDVLNRIMAKVDPAIWRAYNVVRENCRWCGSRVDRADGEKPKHKMYCKLYVGKLHHSWLGATPNTIFGGTDYICSCGASTRIYSGEDAVCKDAANKERPAQ